MIITPSKFNSGTFDLEYIQELLEEQKLPLQMPDYSSQSYWQHRSEKEIGQFYDWYCNYDSLKTYITSFINKNHEQDTLVIGCGKSTLSENLSKIGLQTKNIDFCQQIIQELREKYADQTDMEFLKQDAIYLSFQDKTFDIIIDKGTLDCVLCSQKGQENAYQMIKHVYRVLKNSGVFLMISSANPESRLKFIQQELFNWTIQIIEINKIHLNYLENLDTQKSYYLFICEKS